MVEVDHAENFQQPNFLAAKKLVQKTEKVFIHRAIGTFFSTSGAYAG